MAEKLDPDFILSSQMPDVGAALRYSRPEIQSVLNDCVFVLDTNALLIPYETKKNSLRVIEKVLRDLKGARRLVVPGQVVREFIKNRPGKLVELLAKLKDRPRAMIDLQHAPFLESVSEYKKLQDEIGRAHV